MYDATCNTCTLYLTVQQTTSYNPPHSAPLEEPVLIVDLSEVPDGTLGNEHVSHFIVCNFIITDNSHLSVLVAALSTVYQWFPLGIHLGLSYSSLKTIEANQRGQVEMCKINMLAMWLNGPEEKRSKQFLQDALKQLAQSPQLLSLPNTSAGK